MQRPKRKAAPTNLKDPFPEYQVDNEPKRQRQSTVDIKPTVTHHSNHSEMTAQQLNISQQQLERLKKLMNTYMTHSSTPEGQQALRKFQEALANYQIARKDFDMLATDSGTKDDLLKMAGNSSVSITRTSPDPSTILLADSLAVYFAVKHYWDRGTTPTRVHFYGPLADCQIAAEMFLSTMTLINELCEVFDGNKEDYKKGLVAGFQEKCVSIAIEREKLVEEHKFKVKEEIEMSLTLASKYIISANIAEAVEEKLDGGFHKTQISQRAIVSDDAFRKGKSMGSQFNLEKQLDKAIVKSEIVKVKTEPV